MVEIKWQEPPSRKDGKGLSEVHGQIIEELKKHPGKWALVVEDWGSSAPPAIFRQKGCEVTSRKNKAKEKSFAVYARWPEPSQPEKADRPELPKPDAIRKEAVERAIATGTALVPPPAKPKKVTVPPSNDLGLNRFVAERRARGALAEGA